MTMEGKIEVVIFHIAQEGVEKGRTLLLNTYRKSYIMCSSIATR